MRAEVRAGLAAVEESRRFTRSHLWQINRALNTEHRTLNTNPYAAPTASRCVRTIGSLQVTDVPRDGTLCIVSWAPMRLAR